MKEQLKNTRKLWYVAILMIAACAFNPIYGQSNTTSQDGRTIKGIVSNSDGPLKSVSVILKGSKKGTVTNDDGEFTFPEALKTGDILLISYLGYGTKEIKITPASNFIRAILSEEIIEFNGSLNTNKRYKSKRKN